jgi:PadR family transcriptional regulator PadR
MAPPEREVVQVTLDFLVLKTLDSKQVSEDLLRLNQGTLYPALLRLDQRCWIASRGGISENNHKAEYYSLTRAGRRHLWKKRKSGGRMSAIINRVLSVS